MKIDNSGSEGHLYLCQRSNTQISLVTIPLDGQETVILKENNLLFIIEGRMRYEMGHHRNRTISYGCALNVPEGVKFSYKVEKPVKLLLLKILPPFEFSPSYTFDNLLAGFLKRRGLDYHLNIKKEIWDYLNPLIRSIESGSMCDYYWSLKVKELLYLLKVCYSDDELRALFSNFRMHDLPFADQVKRTYKHFDSITELASSMNMTLGGFQKKFIKVFGVAPRQWMINEKAAGIRQELLYGEKQLKIIAIEYGFAGPSQLNDFCKKHFKKPPGKIRKCGI